MNFHLCENSVVTNTIYYDTPAIADGSTYYQFFFGAKSIVSDVHVKKIDEQFINLLEDNIHARV